MKLGSMADLTADITPEQRERIDAIKTDLVDAERGYELATLRKSQGFGDNLGAGRGGGKAGDTGVGGWAPSGGSLPTGVTDVHAAGYR